MRKRQGLLEGCEVGSFTRSLSNNDIVIARCCFVKDGKEMYDDLSRTCTATVLLMKPCVL